MRVIVALICCMLSLSGDPSHACAMGDKAFERISYPEAVEDYQQGLQIEPDNSDLLWRLARVTVCMAEVEEDAAKRGALLQQAEDAARRCIALDSLKSEGHTWLAGALGYRALDAGMADQVKISQEIMAETSIAIRLDEQNDEALSIRGSFFRALGNVGWMKRQLAALLLGSVPQGGFVDSEAALQAAIRIAPDVMRHWYELGVLYIDWGRIGDARHALREAASKEIRTAIDRPRKEKALKLLRELEEKE
jgi:tetratricopeptide (TPR) repeat protein